MNEGLFGGAGFIPGSRASFSMDLVAAAMLLVVPTLTTALMLARRHKYLAHKRVQLALSAALLIVIVLFEVEVRLYGWTNRAAESPLYDTWLWPVLIIHLFFAVTTTVSWTATVALALKRFASPPSPGAHSPLHRRLARVAAIGMYVTSITGWTFFYMAFLAA